MKEEESEMKKYAKLLGLVLALAMAFSLMAAGTAFADDAKAELPEFETVTPGKLTVATSPDFAPYEFYALDDNGDPTLAGFDVALAQYIADQLDLELEMIPMDFDGTISELGNKTVDLALAGYSPEIGRAHV